MRVKLQLVLCSDDGREETVTDIVTLKKDYQRIEHLGLTLAEAKQLLAPSSKLRGMWRPTPSARIDGAPLKAKEYTNRSFRTLFGTFTLPSPRLRHCTCQRRKTASFRPLSALLTESVAPELLFIESKWSSLASYGLTVKAFKDFLPLDATLAINTVRHDTLKVAERLEAELGEEQWSFIDGGPRDWATLPIPGWPDHRGYRWRLRPQLGGEEEKLCRDCRQEYPGVSAACRRGHTLEQALWLCANRGHQVETTVVRGLDVARLSAQPADHVSLRW